MFTEIHKNKEIICDFCQESLLVPYSQTEKLLHKYIIQYKHKPLTEYQLESLRMLIKMSPEIETFILFNMEEIYNLVGPNYFSNIPADATYFLRNAYLHHRSDTKTKISDMIKCTYCNREACQFHTHYGGMISGRCDMENCNRKYTICGWCQEKSTRYKNKCYHCLKFLIRSQETSDQIKLTKLDTMAIYAKK